MSEKHPHDYGRRAVLKAAGALGAFLGFGGVTAATPGREPGPKPDEVLVGVEPGVSDVAAIVEPELPSDAAVVHTNETLKYAAVTFGDGAAPTARENFKRAIVENRPIRYAEDNVTLEALYTPNDPLYDQQYAPQQVDCEGAWETTLGDPGVTISVIDQGIQYDHPNLAENMDGSVSNYGYDFVENDDDPYPVTTDEDHGTHVGGIAAAGTDNGEGHAGISNCSMLSARALDETGGGALSDIADAIQWSADQGAEVINMSLGGGGYSSTMDDACQYAWDGGSLLVAAAGNDYGGSVSYPAAYDTVMAVSALDENENLATYSSTGPEVELAAPGSNVLSTVNWDDYAEYSGTSMASPVVAGVAGLALSAHSLSNAQLREHLQNTAVDVGLSDDEQGYGRVDANGAVNTDPGDDDDDDDDDDGTCGDRTNVSGVYDQWIWDGEEHCYYYEWQFDDPCQVVIDLQGPDDAVFDLYANEGRAQCPTTWDYDHRSYNWTADEEIVIDDPDTSTPLYVMVHAYSGSGYYDLEITEKAR